MDWSVYIEHLQFVLKDCNSIAAFIDNFLIWYFRNNLRLSICTELDERNHDLDDWQVVTKQVVDAKIKVAGQSFLLTQKSNVCCFRNNRPLKSEKFRDENNFQTKKNHHFSATNSNNRNKEQFG